MWLISNLFVFLATAHDQAIDFGYLSGTYMAQWVFVGYLTGTSIRLGVEIRRTHSDVRRLYYDLERQEQMYRGLFNSAGDAILAVENDRCVEANSRAEHLFGVAPGGLIGKTALEFSPTLQPHGPTRELATIRMQKALAGERQQFTWIHQRANGELFESETTLTSVHIDAGPRLIAVIRDVSQRRHADEERVRLERHAMARQRLALLGQIASGVAQEFRKPLHGLMQYLNLAKSHAGNAAQVRRYADRIDEGLQRIAATSERLLRLGREGTSTQRVIDLAEVIVSTVALVEVAARAKGIAIATHTATAERVLGDAARLSEALLNLLNNSIDACSEGDRIDVELTQDDHTSIIVVCDTGSGIPAEHRERIFEPFFTTKSAGQGTGLGLPIVRQILQEHHGTVELAEGHPRGARLVLRIPRAQTPSREGPRGGHGR
jgi:PAS domain S-box-containing protein